MTTQPEALLLADELEDMTCLWSPSVNRARVDKAAAEMRRLHAENARLTAQRDALLKLLKLARSIIGHPDDAHTQMIDAAIKAVEEGK